MFIDEHTRLVQKFILDELYHLTGNNSGQFHAEEVLMFRDNCQRAEFSNTFYCRELKLTSWGGGPTALRSNALFPSQADRDALWQVLASRFDQAPERPPQPWYSAAIVADLVDCLLAFSDG